MQKRKPLKIAIHALGGQGGGVLSGWLVALAEQSGYIAQSTSVPGVAQRTGATIYYVEWFPKDLADEKRQKPVLALMPVPGDVDVVLASEILEAGRAIDRGFVTSKTTLVSSSHRVFAIGEKIGMGDARVSPDSVIAAAEKAAGKFAVADLEECVNQTGCIISSALFGALAGSDAIPVEREAFEKIIISQKRAVETNLAGFAAGYSAIRGDAPATASASSPEPGQAAPAVRHLLERVKADFPEGVRKIAIQGLKKVVDHQDPGYGELYLDRLAAMQALEPAASQSSELTSATAKHLALWMAYDDTIRVADLKTRSTRFSRFRKDVVAAPDQIVHVSEYMHPRIEEFCDLMPPSMARWVLGSSAAQKVLSVFFGKGRRLPTTKLRGFVPLYVLSALKPWRRRTYKYAVENARIENWLEDVQEVAKNDYALAAELVRLQRLIKGYGDTHERGLGNFNRICEHLEDLKSSESPAASLSELAKAALADEEGVALNAALVRLGQKAAA